MTKFKEEVIGYVDFLHSRYYDGDISKPCFDGRAKINGEQVQLKIWKKPKPEVTNGVMYSGKIYRLMEVEEDIHEVEVQSTQEELTPTDSDTDIPF